MRRLEKRIQDYETMYNDIDIHDLHGKMAKLESRMNMKDITIAELRQVR